MNIAANKFFKPLKNPDFLLLFLTTFFGQIASAFLVLSMIVSVYARTESSYAVSGVILSFTIPGFLLMAFAGIAADIFDRRKIILFANSFIALMVFTILFFKGRVIATTLLSTLYFAGNTFYLPAVQAATAQVAGRRHLLLSNVYFVFTFAGGIILGFFLTSVVHFFLGVDVALWICFCLLMVSVVLTYFLPPLIPKKRKAFSFLATMEDVFKTFGYVFKRKILWFYFVFFALAQGIIAFAATIAPGFFREFLGLSLDRAMIFVFPLIGIGAAIGGGFVNFFKVKEHFLIILGMVVFGVAFLALGAYLDFNFRIRAISYVLMSAFLISVGFADLIIFLASRLAIQKNVYHNYQGTVFGANIILTSVLSAFLSLIAARTINTFGYANTLVFGGVAMLIGVVAVVILAWKWLYAKP